MPRYGYRVLRLRSEQPMKHWTQNQPYTKFALDFKPGDRVLLRTRYETHDGACARGWWSYDYCTQWFGAGCIHIAHVIEEYLIMKP